MWPCMRGAGGGAPGGRRNGCEGLNKSRGIIKRADSWDSVAVMRPKLAPLLLTAAVPAVLQRRVGTL